ncbi:hypothetical protein PHAVU_010G002600 [Phaseolus vulgaris]|uniref:Uncharacterized protein n=1 Tax=Phaseolus vulgaris TaxID=3885 RepID=V7ANW2_PHAVU|nr:hypothetical protein PHAVU_010G002600g [Phaseolus vulgaris]ESW05906.1 hypothetical protein PHAVU_010G002600g [Phaseolus vulgaris]
MASTRERNVDPTSWMFPIQVLLGTIRHGEVEACSISKVPDKLSKPNKDAYLPQLVSIGPYHRGSKNDLLLMMEQPKWNYMLSLLGRSLFQAQQQNRGEAIEDGPRMVKVMGETILEIEYIVRASYGGNVQSEPHDLAKLMLVDGCFLLEFLHRLQEYKEALENGDNEEDDPLFESQDKVLSLLSDLLLLENQLPFIVLKKLYRKLFPVPVPVEQDHRVATMAMEALGYPSDVPTSGAAHLLHLVYLSIVNQEGRKKTRAAHQELKRCATRLRARGVTVKVKEGGRSNTNQFGDIFNFEINFDNGVLEIPQLRIKKSTEVTWRNMIAWEQSRIVTSCKLTSYALFFQGLICCTHDIELLQRVGVIVNESGKRNEDLLKLFENLCEGVDQMDWSYSEVCAKLNSDTGTRSLRKWPILTWHRCRCIIAIFVYYWKNWFSILIKEHIPTIWKLIGVLAAMVLLGLTIAQTYYSAKSSN